MEIKTNIYLSFNLIDSDNPDWINASEMAEKAFKEMDIDKNNKISKNEFLTVCLQSNKVCTMFAT